MARNPLYPRSAGETAVDRLLNQTLPRIIKDKQDRDDRAQQRQDTLDARAQQQENFNKQFTYGIEQDKLKESNRKDEKVSTHFSTATSYAMVGKYEEAESEYQNGLFWAGKWGLSHKDYGSETSRIKIDKVRTTNNTYDTAIGVFNSSMSSPDSVLSAGKSVMGVWGDLSDNQKSEYLQIVKNNEDNQNFVMLNMDRNELDFFDKNSKLYSSTLGKKSGFANLTESQRGEFEAKLPAELQYLGPDATEAQLKRREQELTKLYQSSDLYTSEQEFAKKYVNDTVNMYGGDWATASKLINSMSGFNRDEHISRLALGLVKSGEVKASEIEKNLLEKGISEEAINASGLFKEASGDGDEDGDGDDETGTGIDQATLDVTRARSIERTMGEDGTATKEEIREYRGLLSKYDVKSFGTVGTTYDSETEGSKSRELASKLQNKKTKPNSMSVEEFKDEKDSINKYYEGIIKQEQSVIDDIQNKDLSSEEKRKISLVSKDRIKLFKIQKRKELAKLAGNQSAAEQAAEQEKQIKARIDRYSRGEGTDYQMYKYEPTDADEASSTEKGLVGYTGKGVGSFKTRLGHTVHK